MKNIAVSIVIFVRNPTFLGLELWMQERQAKGALFGLWEFPGGKIEEGETPLDAAKREVHEETGEDVTQIPLLFFKMHPYIFEDRAIFLHVFVAHYPKMKSVGHVGQWFQLDYASQSQNFKGKIPPVNHTIIDELCYFLEKQFKGGTWDFLWGAHGND